MHSKIFATVALLSVVAALQAGPAFGRVNLVAVYERNVTAPPADGAASDAPVVKAIRFSAAADESRKPSGQPTPGEGMTSSSAKNSGDAP
jgi:hypothetical protein